MNYSIDQHTVRHTSLLVVLSFLTVIAASDLHAADPLVLADPDTRPAPIFYGQEAHRLERLAARQMASYLQQITDREFSSRPVPDSVPERAILIGTATPHTENDLDRQAYTITTKDQHLSVRGGSPWGTLYGVYGFLESQLGCRFWSHNEEFVPRQTSLQVHDLNIHESPAFEQHDLYNREAQSTQNHFVYKRRTTSPAKFTGGHNLCKMLKEPAQKNPDFLPMNKKGERKFNNLHMCYTAPGIARRLAEKLEKQVDKRNGNVEDYIYFAGMGDWYGGMCQCPRCKKVYQQETWTDPDGREKPGYSATLLQMINRTADILSEKYPGIKVGTFAYMSLEAPPASVKPRDNVVIRLPHLRHCIVHGIEECEKNQNFLRNLQRWCKIAPDRVYIWDYGASFKNFMYAFPVLRSMAQNIKTYAELGVKGIMIQGNYVSTGSDLAVLKNYVWSRLMWDPSLNVDQLLEEFCEGYYGPAADDMIGYVNALENAVREPRMIHLNEFAKNIRDLYLHDSVVNRMQDRISQAIQATDDQQPYLRRVREAETGLEAARLWHRGPLGVQEGRLIRTDIGEYTFPRAEALLKHSRGASPREWGTGRAYRMEFLSWHGGPLHILTRGNLRVEIAPLLAGRIRQIFYRQQPLLYTGQPSDKTYPKTGGSTEKLQPHARIYRTTGSPTATSVSMEGELGIGNWHAHTKQIVTKKVTLPQPDTLHIATSHRLVRATKKVNATIITQYLPGGGTNDWRVEYENNGNWKEIELDENNTGHIPATPRLRLTLPRRQCTVTDHYINPEVESGKLEYDPKRKRLIVRINVDAAVLEDKEPVEYITRELRFAPLTE